MAEIMEYLEQKKKQIESIIRTLDRQQKSRLSGSLRVTTINGKIRFYQCYYDNNGRRVERYLSEGKDPVYIRRLAQQSYDQKLLYTARKQLATIQTFLSNYEENALSNVYSNLQECRRLLVNPYIPDAKEFIRQWESVQYAPGYFDPDYPEIYSERNERVRSKSEKIIADKYLYLHKPYRYEFPIKLMEDGELTTYRPDFTVLNPRNLRQFYHEHLGKMDDPVYIKRNLKKIETYIQNGIFPGDQLILTHETSYKPLDLEQLNLMIAKYLD